MTKKENTKHKKKEAKEKKDKEEVKEKAKAKKEVKKEEKVVKKTAKKVEEKKKTRKTKKRKKKVKVVMAKGKRKRAIARATVKEGNGIIRINKESIETIKNKYLKSIIMEPLNFVSSKLSKIDVNVNVKGGGVMSQLQAARTAIARALVNYFEDEKLRKEMESYDRYLLGEDVRRVEPKKDRARKARAKYQKSYR